MLDLEFSRLELDIVGIQEGRARSDITIQGVNYIMYGTAAYPNGTAGVQLWIHRRLQHSVITVVRKSPRLMAVVVSIQNSPQRLVLLSAHAPIAAAPAKDIDMFYDALESLAAWLQNKFTKSYTFLLIDANARVGSVPSRCIGTCDPEIETPNGLRLKSFPETLGLMLANTFAPVGPTWVSTYNTSHRIDYIGASSSVFKYFSNAFRADDISLTLGGRVDHYAVCASFEDIVFEKDRHPRKQVINIDKRNLHVPYLQDKFAAEIWKYVPNAYDSPAKHLQSFTSSALRKATAVFGTPGDCPRQPWVSATTWSLLRLTPPLRRTASRFDQIRRRQHLYLVFYQWASVLTSSFPAVVGINKGWSARALADGYRQTSSRLLTLSHALYKYANKISLWMRPMLWRDRAVFIENKAFEAQRAADANDTRSLYGIVRQLGGQASSKEEAIIRRADGSLPISAEERDQAWIEHYANVFQAKIIDNKNELEDARGCTASDDSIVYDDALDFSPSSIEAAMKVMADNKGLGFDNAAIDVLKRGASAVAVQLSRVGVRINRSRKWPLDLTGGRLVSVYKRKSPVDSGDSY